MNISFLRYWPVPRFNNTNICISDFIRLWYFVVFGRITQIKTEQILKDEAFKILRMNNVWVLGAGRMALYVFLKAIGLKKNDEVILPGYTCIVVPDAICRAGGKPVYVDVNRTDANIDVSKVEEKITKQTRVIMVQHSFGIPADIYSIKKLCDKYGILLVEDACHALGAEMDGRPIGSFGDAAFFSFEQSKMVSTDKGGLLVTKDNKYSDKIDALCHNLPLRESSLERRAMYRISYHVFLQHPLIKRLINRTGKFWPEFLKRARDSVLFYDRKEYDDSIEGRFFKPYPRRIHPNLCLLGSMQLKRLKTDIENRNQKAQYLERILPELGVSILTFDHSLCKPSFVRFPFLVDDRKRWINKFASIGLPTGVWLDAPIHPRGSNSEKYFYRAGSCPNAEYLSEHMLNLPVGYNCSLAMLKRIEDLLP